MFMYSISIRNVQSVLFQIEGPYTDEVLSCSNFGDYIKEVLKDVYIVVGMLLSLTVRGQSFTMKVHFS
jgi:hypothetical protein